MERAENNRDYCRRRAAEERAAAAHAADERAAHSHRDLARQFDELAAHPADGPLVEEMVQTPHVPGAEFRIIP